MVAVSNRALQTAQMVEITAKLEESLDGKGAVGKGLHEKATSIERQIPDSLMRQLRFLASVRNQFMHKSYEMPAPDFERLLATASRVLQELQTSQAPARKAMPRAHAAGSASARLVGRLLRQTVLLGMVLGAGLAAYIFFIAPAPPSRPAHDASAQPAALPAVRLPLPTLTDSPPVARQAETRSQVPPSARPPQPAVRPVAREVQDIRTPAGRETLAARAEPPPPASLLAPPPAAASTAEAAAPADASELSLNQVRQLLGNLR